MYVPVKKFSPDQKLWFGKLIVEAIKSDGNIDQDEMNNLLSVLHFLTPEQKSHVTQVLKMQGKLPGLQNVPEGLTKEDLGNIYTQLVVIVVSDSKFTVSEHAFLDRVREWFEFGADIEQKFIEWTEEMLKVTKSRQEIMDALI